MTTDELWAAARVLLRLALAVWFATLALQAYRHGEDLWAALGAVMAVGWTVEALSGRSR